MYAAVKMDPLLLITQKLGIRIPTEKYGSLARERGRDQAPEDRLKRTVAPFHHSWIKIHFSQA